ncbi:hypothetical protein BN8_05610 [Fibrisoma limi BUZ 3]|uniref:HTH luxR-type domain-containing protein n=1 Tax=Fibrisoma limi BUZ 3 TaxID=1185876 RepID=I2GQV8_9BACT|nr:LuxR C-terminal-related transcriptional regulator [Fibrisoma limi]CCH56286.1 hypothetical protein BN8_05610 [Fibrisoma limi BUZ 3]
MLNNNIADDYTHRQWDKAHLSINKLYLNPHIESNPLLEHIFQAANVIPIVADIPRSRIRYLGANPVNWCGWMLNDVFDEGYSSFAKKIHPEDKLIFNYTDSQLKAHLEECNTVDDKFNVKSLCTYRVMHKAGYYRLYKEHTQPIEFDSEGNLLTKLVLLTDITNQLPAHTHYARTYGTKGKERLVQISQQRITKLQALSEREKEIVNYLIQGLNSAEIGEQLFVSKHTIDTHRRRILQKLQASDTLSLYSLFTLLQLNE